MNYLSVLSWKGYFLLFVLVMFFLVFVCGLIRLLDLYLFFIFIFCLFGLGRLNESMWRCNCLVALECFCFCLSWGICVVHLDLYFGVKIVFGNFFYQCGKQSIFGLFNFFVLLEWAFLVKSFQSFHSAFIKYKFRILFNSLLDSVVDFICVWLISIPNLCNKKLKGLSLAFPFLGL